MKKKIKVFTLMEMIVVIVIIGILAAMTIPTFSKLKERNISKQGEMDLIVIYNAEKIYKLDNGKFFYSNSSREIDKALEIDSLNDTYFDYSIIRREDGGFKAIATRNGGNRCDGKYMSITDEGGKVYKECKVWR